MSFDATELDKIIEGKTKKIFQHEDPKHEFNLIYAHSEDNVTAGDGVRHDVIGGKGISCNTTTCNVFKLLNRKQIPTHFIRVIDDRTFLADRLLMVPIEVVVRRFAGGSFCQRNPEIPKRTMLQMPVIEFFLKDDELHDPFMGWDQEQGIFCLYDAHKPLSDKTIVRELDPDDYIGSLGMLRNYSLIPRDQTYTIKELALKAFLIIEKAAMQVGCILQDYKVEFGWNQRGEIKIGDVIDNESWRLWRIHEETGRLIEMSKQVYRDLPEVTPEGLELVRENYEWVAEATKAF